jgi:hypothetical protein
MFSVWMSEVIFGDPSMGDVSYLIQTSILLAL